jgi:hypothetical protein
VTSLLIYIKLGLFYEFAAKVLLTFCIGRLSLVGLRDAVVYMFKFGLHVTLQGKESVLIADTNYGWKA